MKRTLLAAAAILLLSVAAYSNSFNAAFELDDYHQIVENPYIRDASNIPRFFFDPALSTGWSSYFGAAGYRPVTHASFAVSYALSGYNVSGWHAFNLAIHFLNALLVFFIASVLLGDALRKDAFTEALLASAVFAVHPVQTGAVTYVSGRAVLLASFFCLASFAMFLRMRKSGPGSGACKLLYGSLGPVFYLLGLMSKEMAVSLPALMLTYDLLFTAPRLKGPGRLKALWPDYVPYFVALLSYLWLRRYFLGFAATPASPYGVGVYLMSEARALLIYLRVFLLPVNQNADYALPPAGAVDAYIVIAFALVLAALAFAYRARSKAPAVAFSILWFLLALAPESTLFPIADMVVEYRMYLPSVGLIVMSVMLGSAALRRLPRLRLPTAAAAVVLLGLLTFGRNMAWATPSTFWADVLQKSPWSARAHANLGKAFMDEKRYPEAVSEFVDYLQDARAGQDTYLVLNNLGLCYAEMGKFPDAERALKAARDIYPDNADAYYNLAVVYGKMGRKADEAEALRQAEKLKPSAAE